MKKIFFILLSVLIAVSAYAVPPQIVDGNAIYCGNDVAPIKYAVIDDASSPDNTIVTAVTGKRIVVVSYALVASAGVTVRFESGASGTALTGQMSLAANGGVSSGFNPGGHFATVAGALLNLELGGAESVDGHLTYIECD